MKSARPFLQHIKNFTWVQLGTNDGNDEFNSFCKEFNPNKIVLVEPNVILNPFIQDSYKGVNNVILENVAITEVNKGIVKLYLPKELSDETKIKEDIKYATGCFNLSIPVEWYGSPTSIGREIEAPSMTFEELCDKHDIIDIDYLQTDIESWDATILMTIDFDKHNIALIQYESTTNWSTEPIVKFLEDKGYSLYKMAKELNVLAVKNY